MCYLISLLVSLALSLLCTLSPLSSFSSLPCSLSFSFSLSPSLPPSLPLSLSHSLYLSLSSSHSWINQQYQRLDKPSPTHTTELHHIQTARKDSTGQQLERPEHSPHAQATVRIAKILSREAAQVLSYDLPSR